MPEPRTLDAPNAASATSGRLRGSRVGDILPRRMLGTPRGARRLDATAFVIPGSASLTTYAKDLTDRSDAFAAWDGDVKWLPPDGGFDHLVAVVDRYGQIYDITSSAEWTALPSAMALEEWFRLLATACPECGVIDDPLPRTWVP